eukprot:scaffold1647_cov148-Skeletonema_menzelii.AAC.15
MLYGKTGIYLCLASQPCVLMAESEVSQHTTLTQNSKEEQEVISNLESVDDDDGEHNGHQQFQQQRAKTIGYMDLCGVWGAVCWEVRSAACGCSSFCGSMG